MVRQRFGMTVSTGALSVSEPLPDIGTRRCGLCGAGLEVLSVFNKMLEEYQAARAILIVLRGTCGAKDLTAALAVLGMLPRALEHTR